MKSVTKASSLKAGAPVGNNPSDPNQKPKKKIDLPLPLPALIAIGVLVVGTLIFVLYNSQKSKARALEVQQQAAQKKDDRIATIDDIKSDPNSIGSNTNNPNGLQSMNPSPDYFMNQADPIGALAKQSTDQAIKASPNYQPGLGLKLPNGSILAENSPELMGASQQITASVLGALNRSVTTQQNGQGGTVYMYQSPQGQSIPLATQEAQAQLQQYAFSTANTELQNYLNAQKPAVVEPQQPVQAPPVQQAMNSEEKQALLDIVNLQKQQISELRQQNKNVKQQMQQQETQVAQVFQKLEDSPTASQKLRATMLPKSTGLKYVATVNGRIWLEDRNKNQYTLTPGQVVPGTELRIVDADADTGIVLVTPRK